MTNNASGTGKLTTGPGSQSFFIFALLGDLANRRHRIWARPINGIVPNSVDKLCGCRTRNLWPVSRADIFADGSSRSRYRSSGRQIWSRSGGCHLSGFHHRRLVHVLHC